MTEGHVFIWLDFSEHIVQLQRNTHLFG